MTPEIARKLLPIVNSPGFDEIISDYVEGELAAIHKTMEQTPDPEVWRTMKGQALALRRFKSLRTDAVAVMKNETQ